MDVSLSYPTFIYRSPFATISKFLSLLYKLPGTDPGFVCPEAYTIYGKWGSLLIKKYEILNSKSAILNCLKEDLKGGNA